MFIQTSDCDNIYAIQVSLNCCCDEKHRKSDVNVSSGNGHSFETKILRATKVKLLLLELQQPHCTQ